MPPDIIGLIAYLAVATVVWPFIAIQLQRTTSMPSKDDIPFNVGGALLLAAGWPLFLPAYGVYAIVRRYA